MDKIQEIEEAIELAIMANGGTNHRREWCQCDPSVGYTPCEYCAIFNGLNKAKDLLSRIKELEDKKDRSDEMRDHPNPLCRP